MPIAATSLGTMRIHLVGYTTTQAVFWDDISIEGEMTCAGTRMSYYPYGLEMGSVTANDTAKFGTYTRDAATGLDYAMNRYYQSTWGRFTSPDPYRASGGPGDPGSWNRYAYVQGDPVNYFDPEGLLRAIPKLVPNPSYIPAEIGPSISEIAIWYPDEYGSQGGRPWDTTEAARFHLGTAVDLLRKALSNPDCANIFTSPGIGPVGLLDGLLDGGFGSVIFADLRNDPDNAHAQATVEPLRWDGIAGGFMKVNIIVNARDDFSLGVYWNGNSGGDIGRARMLLHELGHVANNLLGFGGSKFRENDAPGSSPDWAENQKHNQALERKCFP